MRTFTKDKTFFTVITEKGETGFINDTAERRRYCEVLKKTAENHDATLLWFEYYACAAYVMLETRNEKRIGELLNIANRNYCAFLKLKEREKYFCREFEVPAAIELHTEAQKQMLIRALNLAMRW